MKNERGITVIIAALTMPVILMLLGLSIDLGIVYVSRTSAQGAADAAALAGAYSYMKNPASPTPQADAVLFANQNTILGHQVNITTSNVTLPACTGGHCVTVTIPFNAPVFFARMFGWQSLRTTVRATAQAGTSASGAYCLKPVFGPSVVLEPGGVPLVPGTLLPDIRPVAANAAYAPSNYYSLDFTHIDNISGAPNSVTYSDGTVDTASGVPTYMDGWEKCIVSPVIKCGDTINLQPGNMGNNTNNAVSQYTDIYNAPGDYGSSHTDTAPGLVSIAIWNSISPLLQSGNNFYATVIGFATIFIPVQTATHGNNVNAYFIGATPCGVGGGVVSGTGPTGAPLRLVQQP
jgi:Putative Flp pilus-assembly TadE/G-like